MLNIRHPITTSIVTFLKPTAITTIVIFIISYLIVFTTVVCIISHLTVSETVFSLNLLIVLDRLTFTLFSKVMLPSDVSSLQKELLHLRLAAKTQLETTSKSPSYEVHSSCSYSRVFLAFNFTDYPTAFISISTQTRFRVPPTQTSNFDSSVQIILEKFCLSAPTLF